MINEKRLISAVVNQKDIAPVLNSSNVDVLFMSHSDIWQYIKDYYYKNRSVVPKAVLEEAFSSEDFRVLSEDDTSGTVKHYLEQLRNEYAEHMLERTATGLAKDLGSKPTELLVQKLTEIVLDLQKATTAAKDLDITNQQQAVDYYTDVKRRMDENGGVLGVRFGYDSIDASYPTGIAGGQFIWVISRTNQGKSWLGLDIALNAWAQRKKILWVSLEMSPQSVRDRAYTFMSEGKFKISDLSRAQIDLDELEKWTASSMSGDGSFIVTSTDGMGDFTPAQLQAKIDQYAPDVVFVDYLQLMSDNRGSAGETERIRNVSKELKSLSLSNDIPIVTIVSASSNDTKEYSKPPEVFEVASSRQAAFDADLILSMFSNKQSDGTMITEIVAKKNRHGPLFSFNVIMDIENGNIREDWGAGLIDDEDDDI